MNYIKVQIGATVVDFPALITRKCRGETESKKLKKSNKSLSLENPSKNWASQVNTSQGYDDNGGKH